MSKTPIEANLRGKGQAGRLGKQHELAGGPLGIFGEEAQKHDASIREVVELIEEHLKKTYTNFTFRHRKTLSKKEINEKLSALNSDFGQVLFVRKSSIKPDGGIIEVKDTFGKWRIVLVGESKHQGNDVEKIEAGIKQGKNKDKDLMVAGNAIERVHKNILEFRNVMLDELHFPYVVFFQGSNFATKTFSVESPDGRKVKISHDAGAMNRIDRITASSFGMQINKNYCKNIFVKCGNNLQMLQVASLYFQCPSWTLGDMSAIMYEIAQTSLDVLSDSLPPS
jgi:type II restriction enzyme